MPSSQHCLVPVLVSQTALILLITPFLSVIVSCWTLDTMDLIMVPRIIIIAHSERSEIYKLTRQQQEDASVIGKMWNKKFSLGGNIIFPTIHILDRLSSDNLHCILAPDPGQPPPPLCSDHFHLKIRLEGWSDSPHNPYDRWLMYFYCFSINTIPVQWMVDPTNCRYE